jgi:hypothetical protein
MKTPQDQWLALGRAIGGTVVIGVGSLSFGYCIVQSESELALVAAGFALTALYLIFGRDPPRPIV